MKVYQPVVGVVQSELGFFVNPSLSTDEIQTLVNNHDYTSTPLLFGRSIHDLYITDKEIILPDNAKIIVNGTIKPKVYTTSLTQDYLVGSKRVYIDNSNGDVKVGMHMGVSDPTQPQQGGGAWKTSKIGISDIVTVATSTYFEFNQTLADRPQYTNNGGYTVSNGATTGIYHSIFSYDTKTGIRISGSGIIDMDLNNHWGKDYVCLRPTEISESLESACGISIKDSNDFQIRDINIINAAMHGISLRTQVSPPYILNTNFLIEDVTIDGAHEKSIAILSCEDFVIRGVVATNGVGEGDIICYQNCARGVIENCTSLNNRRFGIAILQTNDDITVRNNTVGNCGVASFYHVGQVGVNQNHTFENFTISHPTSLIGGGITMINASFVTLRNISANMQGAGYSIFGIQDCSDITITTDNGTSELIGNSFQSGVVGTQLNTAISLVRNTNVTFNDVVVKNVRTVFKDGGGNTGIVFNNGELGFRSIDNVTTFPWLDFNATLDSMNNVTLN